eukprot:TRINITY_DN5366_c0_g1_i1.p1 TRINITY_DN5366_c0_g1~~TRINITY_DN5366_c0_g1_i1.p1  ORF type:complete len:1397 (+),score=333.84 TRINITY_DN5366_c0_g1_i1:50-4192(+)
MVGPLRLSHTPRPDRRSSRAGRRSMSRTSPRDTSRSASEHSGGGPVMERPVLLLPPPPPDRLSAVEAKAGSEVYRRCGGMVGRDMIMRCLEELGQPMPTDKLKRLLDVVGYTALTAADGTVQECVSHAAWLQILTLLKVQHARSAAQPDRDIMEAFSSLGGGGGDAERDDPLGDASLPDTSGQIAVEQLKTVVNTFQLAVDVEAVMDEIDGGADGLLRSPTSPLSSTAAPVKDGKVDYEEFKMFLLHVRQAGAASPDFKALQEGTLAGGDGLGDGPEFDERDVTGVAMMQQSLAGAAGLARAMRRCKTNREKNREKKKAIRDRGEMEHVEELRRRFIRIQMNHIQNVKLCREDAAAVRPLGAEPARPVAAARRASSSSAPTAEDLSAARAERRRRKRQEQGIEAKVKSPSVRNVDFGNQYHNPHKSYPRFKSFAQLPSYGTIAELASMETSVVEGMSQSYVSGENAAVPALRAQSFAPDPHAIPATLVGESPAQSVRGGVSPRSHLPSPESCFFTPPGAGTMQSMPSRTPLMLGLSADDRHFAMVSPRPHQQQHRHQEAPPGGAPLFPHESSPRPTIDRLKEDLRAKMVSENTRRVSLRRHRAGRQRGRDGEHVTDLNSYQRPASAGTRRPKSASAARSPGATVSWGRAISSRPAGSPVVPPDAAPSELAGTHPGDGTGSEWTWVEEEEEEEEEEAEALPATPASPPVSAPSPGTPYPSLCLVVACAVTQTPPMGLWAMLRCPPQRGRPAAAQPLHGLPPAGRDEASTSTPPLAPARHHEQVFAAPASERAESADAVDRHPSSALSAGAAHLREHGGMMRLEALEFVDAQAAGPRPWLGQMLRHWGVPHRRPSSLASLWEAVARSPTCKELAALQDCLVARRTRARADVGAGPRQDPGACCLDALTDGTAAHASPAGGQTNGTADLPSAIGALIDATPGDLPWLALVAGVPGPEPSPATSASTAPLPVPDPELAAAPADDKLAAAPLPPPCALPSEALFSRRTMEGGDAVPGCAEKVETVTEEVVDMAGEEEEEVVNDGVDKAAHDAAVASAVLLVACASAPPTGRTVRLVKKRRQHVKQRGSSARSRKEPPARTIPSPLVTPNVDEVLAWLDRADAEPATPPGPAVRPDGTGWYAIPTGASAAARAQWVRPWAAATCGYEHCEACPDGPPREACAKQRTPKKGLARPGTAPSARKPAASKRDKPKAPAAAPARAEGTPKGTRPATAPLRRPPVATSIPRDRAAVLAHAAPLRMQHTPDDVRAGRPRTANPLRRQQGCEADYVGPAQVKSLRAFRNHRLLQQVWDRERQYENLRYMALAAGPAAVLAAVAAIVIERRGWVEEVRDFSVVLHSAAFKRVFGTAGDVPPHLMPASRAPAAVY